MDFGLKPYLCPAKILAPDPVKPIDARRDDLEVCAFWNVTIAVPVDVPVEVAVVDSVDVYGFGDGER